MTRSLRVSHASVAKRDPHLARGVEQLLAAPVGLTAEPPPPPTALPLQLGDRRARSRLAIAGVAAAPAGSGPAAAPPLAALAPAGSGPAGAGDRARRDRAGRAGGARLRGRGGELAARGRRRARRGRADRAASIVSSGLTARRARSLVGPRLAGRRRDRPRRRARLRPAGARPRGRRRGRRAAPRGRPARRARRGGPAAGSPRSSHDRPATRAAVVGHAAQLVRAGADLLWVTSPGDGQRAAPRRAARRSPAQRARRRDLRRRRRRGCCPISTPRSPPAARISSSWRGCPPVAAPAIGLGCRHDAPPLPAHARTPSRSSAAATRGSSATSSARRRSVFRDGDWLSPRRRREPGRRRTASTRPRARSRSASCAAAPRAPTPRGCARSSPPPSPAARRSPARTDGIRLVHGESDGLPAVVVDRFGDTLVATSYSAGADALARYAAPRARARRRADHRRSCSGPRTAAAATPAARARAPRARRRRSPASPRTASRSPSISPAGRRPARTSICAACAARSRPRPLAGARVLNLFAYSGMLGRAAEAAGAASITQVDASERALAFAAAHHVTDPARHTFVTADVFEWLPALAADDGFDLVIVDPPAMTSQQGAGARPCSPRTASCTARPRATSAPGGALVAACCTSRIERAVFHRRRPRGARRRLRARARAPARARSPGRLSRRPTT